MNTSRADDEYGYYKPMRGQVLFGNYKAISHNVKRKYSDGFSEKSIEFFIRPF